MKTKTLNYISTVILLLALGGLIYLTYLGFDMVGMFGGDELIIVLLLMVVFIVLQHFINIIFHELGHLLFGLANKFSCYSYSVAWLTFSRKGVKFSVRNNLGACVMVPRTTDKFYKHTFLYLLGGGIFSLLMLAQGGVFLFVQMGLPKYAHLFLGVGFLVHGYLFFRNILPFSSFNNDSDGAKMLGIIRKTPQMRINLKLFSVQCLLISGTQPQQIDEKLLFDLPVVADNSQERILIEDYRFLYYLDKGDAENARKSAAFLEEFLPDVDDYYYHAILSDVFYSKLVLGGDREAAQKMYPDVEKLIKADKNISSMRLKMCYELMINNEPKKAIAIGREALQLGKDYILAGVVPLEKRLINEMLTAAEKLRDEKEEKSKICVNLF